MWWLSKHPSEFMGSINRQCLQAWTPRNKLLTSEISYRGSNLQAKVQCYIIFVEYAPHAQTTNTKHIGSCSNTTPGQTQSPATQGLAITVTICNFPSTPSITYENMTKVICLQSNNWNTYALAYILHLMIEVRTNLWVELRIEVDLCG